MTMQTDGVSAWVSFKKKPRSNAQSVRDAKKKYRKKRAGKEKGKGKEKAEEGDGTDQQQEYRYTTL